MPRKRQNLFLFHFLFACSFRGNIRLNFILLLYFLFLEMSYTLHRFHTHYYMLKISIWTCLCYDIAPLDFMSRWCRKFPTPPGTRKCMMRHPKGWSHHTIHDRTLSPCTLLNSQMLEYWMRGREGTEGCQFRNFQFRNFKLHVLSSEWLIHTMHDELHLLKHFYLCVKWLHNDVFSTWKQKNQLDS